MIEGISAITLATQDMRRAVRFYRVLGFAMLYGGEDEGFTSFKAGSNFVNLIAQPAARDILDLIGRTRDRGLSRRRQHRVRDGAGGARLRPGSHRGRTIASGATRQRRRANKKSRRFQ